MTGDMLFPPKELPAEDNDNDLLDSCAFDDLEEGLEECLEDEDDM